MALGALIIKARLGLTDEELDSELNDLRRTLAALGAAAEQELSADQFLELLRNKARLLEQSGSEENRIDLAEAIRRELRA